MIPDTTAIRLVVAAFVSAFNDGNLEALMDTYSADVLYLPQGAATIRGRTEVERLHRATFERSTRHLAVNVEEIRTMGDFAYDRGTFELTLTPKGGGGEARTATRRFIELWRKEADGKWRVLEVMNNADR